MTVGEKIYALRTQAGYSQEEFAELIGVSRQSVSKWETSAVMPDTEYVVKICKILSVSTDTLLMDDDLQADVASKLQKETDLPYEANVTKQIDRATQRNMILKRVLLIVTAGVLHLLMCLYVYFLVRFVKMDYENYVGDMVVIMSYVSNITFYLREICLLAVVDFLFCVGQKRYNKGMFGISIALFAVAVTVLFANSPLSGLNTFFFNKPYETSSTTMSLFYLWTALSTLPFVGLAVAYIVVKAKYLKSQSNHA